MSMHDLTVKVVAAVSKAVQASESPEEETQHTEAFLRYLKKFEPELVESYELEDEEGLTKDGVTWEKHIKGLLADENHFIYGSLEKHYYGYMGSGPGLMDVRGYGPKGKKNPRHSKLHSNAIAQAGHGRGTGKRTGIEKLAALRRMFDAMDWDGPDEEKPDYVEQWEGLSKEDQDVLRSIRARAEKQGIEIEERKDYEKWSHEDLVVLLDDLGIFGETRGGTLNVVDPQDDKDGPEGVKRRARDVADRAPELERGAGQNLNVSDGSAIESLISTAKDNKKLREEGEQSGKLTDDNRRLGTISRHNTERGPRSPQQHTVAEDEKTFSEDRGIKPGKRGYGTLDPNNTADLQPDMGEEDLKEQNERQKLKTKRRAAIAAKKKLSRLMNSDATGSPEKGSKTPTQMPETSSSVDSPSSVEKPKGKKTDISSYADGFKGTPYNEKKKALQSLYAERNKLMMGKYQSDKEKNLAFFQNQSRIQALTNLTQSEHKSPKVQNDLSAIRQKADTEYITAKLEYQAGKKKIKQQAKLTPKPQVNAPAAAKPAPNTPTAPQPAGEVKAKPSTPQMSGPKLQERAGAKLDALKGKYDRHDFAQEAADGDRLTGTDLKMAASVEMEREIWKHAFVLGEFPDQEALDDLEDKVVESFQEILEDEDLQDKIPDVYKHLNAGVARAIKRAKTTAGVSKTPQTAPKTPQLEVKPKKPEPKKPEPSSVQPPAEPPKQEAPEDLAAAASKAYATAKNREKELAKKSVWAPSEYRELALLHAAQVVAYAKADGKKLNPEKATEKVLFNVNKAKMEAKAAGHLDATTSSSIKIAVQNYIKAASGAPSPSVDQKGNQPAETSESTTKAEKFKSTADFVKYFGQQKFAVDWEKTSNPDAFKRGKAIQWNYSGSGYREQTAVLGALSPDVRLKTMVSGYAKLNKTILLGFPNEKKIKNIDETFQYYAPDFAGIEQDTNAANTANLIRQSLQEATAAVEPIDKPIVVAHSGSIRSTTSTGDIQLMVPGEKFTLGRPLSLKPYWDEGVNVSEDTHYEIEFPVGSRFLSSYADTHLYKHNTYEQEITAMPNDFEYEFVKSEKVGSKTVIRLVATLKEPNSEGLDARLKQNAKRHADRTEKEKLDLHYRHVEAYNLLKKVRDAAPQDALAKDLEKHMAGVLTKEEIRMVKEQLGDIVPFTDEVSSPKDEVSSPKDEVSSPKDVSGELDTSDSNVLGEGKFTPTQSAPAGGINAGQTTFGKVSTPAGDVSVVQKTPKGGATQEYVAGQIGQILGMGELMPDVGFGKDGDSRMEMVDGTDVATKFGNSISAENLVDKLAQMRNVAGLEPNEAEARKAAKAELDKINLFDYVTGNDDRARWNLFVTDKGQLRMIDHGMVGRGDYAQYAPYEGTGANDGQLRPRLRNWTHQPSPVKNGVKIEVPTAADLALEEMKLERLQKLREVLKDATIGGNLGSVSKSKYEKFMREEFIDNVTARIEHIVKNGSYSTGELFSGGMMA